MVNRRSVTIWNRHALYNRGIAVRSTEKSPPKAWLNCISSWLFTRGQPPRGRYINLHVFRWFGPSKRDAEQRKCQCRCFLVPTRLRAAVRVRTRSRWSRPSPPALPGISPTWTRTTRRRRSLLPGPPGVVRAVACRPGPASPCGMERRCSPTVPPRGRSTYRWQPLGRVASSTRPAVPKSHPPAQYRVHPNPDLHLWRFRLTWACSPENSAFDRHCAFTRLNRRAALPELWQMAFLPSSLSLSRSPSLPL